MAKMTYTREEVERRKKEDREYLNGLVESGRTASGRTLEETLAIPKSASESYGRYLGKYKSIMGGKTDYESIQSARKDAFYARNYIENNAERYDADHGEGSSQAMLDYLKKSVGEIDLAQDRRFNREQKAEKDELALRRGMNAEQSGGQNESVMNDALARLKKTGDTSIRAYAQKKRDTVREKENATGYNNSAWRDYMRGEAGKEALARDIESQGMTGSLQSKMGISEREAQALVDKWEAEAQRKKKGQKEVAEAATLAAVPTARVDASGANANGGAAEAAALAAMPTERVDANSGAAAYVGKWWPDKAAKGEAVTPMDIEAKLPELNEAERKEVMEGWSQHKDEILAKWGEQEGEVYQAPKKPLPGEKTAWEKAGTFITDPLKGAYDMTIGTLTGTSYDKMMEDDKRLGREGFGAASIPAVIGAGVVAAGGNFNDTMLGIAENLHEYGKSVASIFGVKTNEWNPANELRVQNAENARRVLTPMLEKGTALENMAMNIVSSSIGSLAMMTMGTAAGIKVGNGLGGGAGTVNTALGANHIGNVVSGTQMAPFALQAATEAYDAAEEQGLNGHQAAASAITAGLMSIASNASAFDEYCERMGIGVKSNDVLLASASGAKLAGMSQNAMQWMQDAFGTMGIKEGLQEVCESFTLKLNKDMWAGSFFDDSGWKDWTESAKQEFVFGYLSGALFYTSAIQEYMPSQVMLRSMMDGETETSAESLAAYVAQVQRDMQKPEAKEEAQKRLAEQNKAMQTAQYVKEGMTVEEARTAAERSEIEGKQPSTDDKLLLAAEELIAREKGEAGIPLTQNAPQSTEAGMRDAPYPMRGNAEKPLNGRTRQGEIAITEQERATANMAPSIAAHTDADAEADERSTMPNTAEEAEGAAPSRIAGETMRVNTGKREEEVTVAGVRAVKNGAVYLDTVDAQGNKGVVLAGDASFDSDELNELMAAGVAEKMNKRGVDAYLTSYDGTVASIEEYAHAFRGVYASAKAGIDYQSATALSHSAQTYLTSDARMAAYAAGAGVGISKMAEQRNTVKSEKANTGGSYSIDPANQNAKADTTAPKAKTVQKNADAAQNEKKQPGLIKDYSNEAFNAIGNSREKRQALFEFDVLDALAKKLEIRIRVKDDIRVYTRDESGRRVARKANGSYKPQTGEITLSLAASDKAYTYVAMHELTHMLRAEHPEQWDAFSDFVTDVMIVQGVDVNALLVEQKATGMDTDTALEEVVCNAVPAVLKSEENLKKLLEIDKGLFERIKDFISEFIRKIKYIGTKLSQKEQWGAVDKLAQDTEALEVIYDRMMEILTGAEDEQSSGVKFKSMNMYTKETQEMIREYKRSIDTKLLEMAKKVEAGSNEYMAAYRFAEANHRLCDDIMRIFGIDVSGFEIAISKDALEHIKNRHGTSGAANSTMQNKNDVARIPFVVQNYDVLECALDQKGNAAYSEAYRDKSNNKAAVAKISKKINGTFYIALIVPDSKTKTLWIQSAYINQKGEVQAPDAFAPSKTAETALESSPSTIVRNNDEKVNGNFNKTAEKEQNHAEQQGGTIKYSLTETSEELQAQQETLKEAFELTHGHHLTALDAKKIADGILKESNSEYDAEDLAEELAEAYSYAERAKTPDMEHIDEMLLSAAQHVLSKSATLDMEHAEMAKPIRSYLRTTAISLSTAQLAEAAYLSGSVGAFRKELFGRVRLSQKASSSLEQVWAELNEMNAGLFPQDASEADMPRMLVDAVDALSPVYRSGYGFGMEEAAQYITMRMNETYLKLPSVKASAKEMGKLGVTLEAYSNATTAFKDESKADFENALRGVAEAKKQQQMNESQVRAAAIRKKYATWRNKDTAMRKERENVNRYRAKVEKTTRELLAWVEHPTDQKHVDQSIVKTVRELLAVLSFDGKAQKAGELQRRLEKMAFTMRKAEEGEYENTGCAMNIDPEISEQLEKLALAAEGMQGVYEMDGAQLKELSRWMDALKYAINTANELHIAGKRVAIAQMGERSIAELGTHKEASVKKGMQKMVDDLLNTGMLDPTSFFAKLKGAAAEVYQELRNGLDAKVRDVEKAKSYFEKISKGYKLDEMTGKKAKAKAFDVTGGTLEMTKAQIMCLYVLNKREQAREHIYEGKISIGGKETARALVTELDVQTICGTLTEEEKKLADQLQRFLATDCAEWGNETSLEMYGYEKFTEKNYFPIETNSDFNKTLKREGDKGSLYRLKNLGMTKATTEGAKNPVVIRDVFDVFFDHIDKMSSYHAFMMPSADMMNWYNYKQTEGDTSVKESINRAYGKKAKDYIERLVEDINGASKSGESIEILDKTLSAAKVAAVGANVRVVLQQPCAYIRAMAVMNPKYMAMALAKKPQIEAAKKHCPIALWKSWGYYDTNLGMSMRELMIGQENAVQKIREGGLWMAGKADEITWGYLFNACEAEVQELQPTLIEGSEAYYKAVGKRLSEVIDKTQVVDSVFHKSPIMRSDSGLTRLATTFMAEPNKTYNMIRNEIADFASDRSKQNGMKLARVLTTYALSGVATAAAAAIADAFRDDDDDKKFWEKYLNATWGNTLDNLNPMGMIPVLKDVLSMMQGYKATRMDQQGISRLIEAATEWKKYAEGTSRYSTYGMVYKTAQALSTMTGIPAANVMRTCNSLYSTITHNSPVLSESATSEVAAKNLYEATLKGDKEALARIRAKLATGKSAKNPAEIDAMIAKKLAESDPRIASAWEAKKTGSVRTLNALRSEIRAGGFSGEVVDKAITIYASSQAEKKSKDAERELNVKLYKTEDLAEATRKAAKNGSVEDVKLVFAEMVADSEAKEPAKTVREGAVGMLRAEYVQMVAEGDRKGADALANAMVKGLGVDKKTLTGWVESAHRDDLIKGIDAGDTKQTMEALAQMKADGRDDQSIYQSLRETYEKKYQEACRAGDGKKAGRIKAMLRALGLKNKEGDNYFSEKVFNGWAKK